MWSRIVFGENARAIGSQEEDGRSDAEEANGGSGHC